MEKKVEMPEVVTRWLKQKELFHRIGRAHIIKEGGDGGNE
jgi:hypothetical protein